MRFFYLLLFAVLIIPRYAFSSPDYLADLELEALMDLEVTSVNKRVQPLSDSPAAIYVISNQEIKRSGVTTLPDALRLAPGVEVGRLNRSTWAISIRGFNSSYSQNLLVLVDGRSVYNPAYGGVYWDLVMPMLEDIDQIEVIRGPGASLWGVNAVNGVINIITKSPEITQGERVVAALGNEESYLRARTGGKSGNVFYRGYSVYRNGDSNTSFHTGESAEDEFEGGQIGFRADIVDGAERIVVQSDFSGHDKTMSHAISEHVGEVGNRFDSISYNALTRWHKPVGDDQFQLQVYYDYLKRDDIGYEYNLHTYDIDFQYNFDWRDGNRITWGLGYRYYDDEIEGSDIYDFSQSARRWDIISFFVQDEFKLTDQLTFIAGIKLEQIADLDTAWQPTLRFNYLASDELSYWGSISRAIRTPSRMDLHGDFSNELPNHLRAGTIQLLQQQILESISIEDLLNQDLSELSQLASGFLENLQGDGPVIVATVRGSEDLEPEELIAYEAGFRWQPLENLFWDVAAFRFNYSDLRSLEIADWGVTDNGFYGILQAINLATGRFHGIETAMEFRRSKDLTFKFNYSYLKVIIDNDNFVLAQEFFERASPLNQFSFRTHYDYNDWLSIDTDLYFVDQIQTGTYHPSDYADINFRINVDITPQLTTSFVVMNLLHEDRFEYQETNLGPALTEIDQGFYIELEWRQ